MLTMKEFEQTAQVAHRSVEELFHPFNIEPELEPQEFNVNRVYRLLIRDSERLSGALSIPQNVFRDAVIAETHVPSGMDRHNRLLTKNEDVLVRSVRLVHVGNEELLVKVMLWWVLLCAANKSGASTVVVEQDAFVAQEQIRRAGLQPRVLYNMQQFIELDMPVKSETRKGEKIWYML